MEARKRTQRTAIPDGASTDDVAADEPAQKHPPASPSNNRRKRGKKAINCSVSSLFLFVILGWCTTALVLLKVSSTPNGETSSLSTSTSSRSYSYNQREFPLIRTLFQTLPEGGIKFPSHEDRFRVPETFLPAKPRVVGYYFATATTDKGSFLGSEPLDPNLIKLYRSRNAVLEYVSSRDIDAQKALKNSKDYWHGAQDPMSEEEECEAQYDWQLHSFPTCNLLHEIDMTYMSNQKGDERNRLIAHGYWRDVWLPSAFGKMVLKTIRWAHDFTERNFDRHRRDAVAMERLSSSPNVMDIYGYCGNSGMFEFADGGDIEDSLWNDKGLKWSSQENLMVAYQVVSGLADVHEYGAHDIAAIAHADITTSQFVYVREEQTFKLNDFNRCRFMAWNPKTKKQCGFYVGNNPGLFRAPEEYAYTEETEKIDVYSLGNVFYAILTQKEPFEDESDSEDVQKRIKHGARPHISSRYKESEDPFDQAMIKAIHMCWVQDASLRASALEVKKFIESELVRLKVIDPDEAGEDKDRGSKKRT